MTISAEIQGPPPTDGVLKEPAARLTNVRKRFGYRDVLRGVTLEIPTGSCFVITGPNGAGKSTLVRILATYWSCTSGNLQVLGQDAKRSPHWIRSRIGIVFHEPFLRREMTLEENLRFCCAIYGVTGKSSEERIASLLERFGLAHRRKDAVGTFSQGMLKRASLARSLVNDPLVWILDEPFSGLDPSGQELLTQSVDGYLRQGAGRTVVMITHQLALGRRLATSSVRIEDGKIASLAPGAGAMSGFSEESSSSREVSEP